MRLAKFLLPYLMLCACVQAKIEPNFLFCDGMVLQRGKPIPVWGSAAAPGETITVTFKGQTSQTKADENGRWKVWLPAQAADPKASTLRIAGEAPADALTFGDVVVGEVWVAGGQSNMEWRLKHADNAAEEIASANNPLIREFRVKRRAVMENARPDKGQSDFRWAKALPDTIGPFSAVAYFFAKARHRDNGVPIGIINTSSGGTQIESWIAHAALQGDPAFKVVFDRWAQTLADYPALKAKYDADLAQWQAEDSAAKAKGQPLKRKAPRPPEGPGDRKTPSSLFNGMIEPLLPYAINGFIWYQGEANILRPQEYRALLVCLIDSWRADFAQGDLPFYIVQLPNFETVVDKTGEGWARVREAQAQAAQTLPNCEIVPIIDVGDSKNVHPPHKETVGRRLAGVARHYLDGDTAVFTGPRLKSAAAHDGKMRIYFDHVGTGLVLGEAPWAGFSLAGADSRYHQADHVAIDGESLVLWAKAVPAPLTVRYAWGNAPAIHLSNREGFPAMPFRTDTQATP